jgi:hypothetical protein
MMRARDALKSAAPLAILLATAGCNRHQARTDQAGDAAALPALPASLPLSSAPASGPIATAPSAARLPPTRPLDLGYVPADQDYAWIDRADMLFDTIGDAPPDYGFDYDGVEPWAWETAGGYDIFAEPIEDGYRTYYYEPGADEPFLVRDPAYSYGYGDGRLIAVYAGGRLLDRAAAARQAAIAARYWARARALRSADRAVDRRPVAAARWAGQRSAFVRARQEWTQARERDPAWRQWRARAPAGPARRRLQAEQGVRAAAAERFAQWQEQGLRGPAPRLYPAAVVRRQRGGAARPEQAAPMQPQGPRLRQAPAEPRERRIEQARPVERARGRADRAAPAPIQAAPPPKPRHDRQASQPQPRRQPEAVNVRLHAQARGAQARQQARAAPGQAHAMQAQARQQAQAAQAHAAQAQARQQARAAQMQARAAQNQERRQARAAPPQPAVPRQAAPQQRPAQAGGPHGGGHPDGKRDHGRGH